MKIEHKIFEAEVKAFDDENLIVENFISTEHKDRGGDIMRAKGMKIVGKPVVLLLHGRGPMRSEPVGKPLSITIDEFKGQPGILARTQFYDDEVGRRLYGKVKGGFLPNWSIGYSVDEAKDLLREGRYDGRDVTKWQLFEYSPVGVPMNPFAQTVKEFLDDVDANADMNKKWFAPRHDEIVQATNGAWFGVVEEKSCTGCGACGKKHPCPNCKGDLTLFVKDGDNIGIACEKCEPEKFAELTKAIAPPEPPADDGGFMMQLQTLKGLIEGMRDTFKDVPEKLKLLDEKFAKLEPLLATLPPEPDGGDKGEEGEGNPPEPETPPRLIFKGTAQEKEEAARIAKEQRASVVAAVATAMKPLIDAQADRLMGRVN